MNNSLGQKQDSSVVSTADASTMADEPVRQRLSDYEKRLFYLGKTAKEKALLKAAAKGEDDGRTSKRDHGDEGTNEKKKQANSKPRNISCCCCNLSCCCCAKSFCGLILLLFLVLLVDEFLFFHGYYDVWFYGGKKKYDYYQIKRIKTYPSGYQEEELYYVRRGRQNGEEEYARAEDLEYDARTRDYYHKTNYNFDYDDRGAGASDYYQRDRASSSRQGQHNINSRSSTGTASPDDVKRPTKVQEAKHAAARQKQREGSHAFAKEVGRQGSEIARERASTTAAVMGDKNQKNENPGAAPGFVQKKQEQERDDHVGQKQENEIYQQTTTPTSSSTSSSQRGDHTSSSVDSKVSPPHPPPPQELAPGRNDQDGAPAKMTASSVQGSIPKDQEQNHEAGKVSQQHQVQDPEEQPMKQENGQHQEEKKSENDVKTTPSSSSISSTTTTVGSSVNKDPTTSSSTSSKGKRPGTWLEGKSKMFRDSGTDEDETSEDDLALFKDDADAFKTTENYPHQQGTVTVGIDVRLLGDCGPLGRSVLTSVRGLLVLVSCMLSSQRNYKVKSSQPNYRRASASSVPTCVKMLKAVVIESRTRGAARTHHYKELWKILRVLTGKLPRSVFLRAPTCCRFRERTTLLLSRTRTTAPWRFCICWQIL
ncbi:unnamed protein product [Amoebophrya sp. A120]|nr:unnamed protein product [Amoebophrya sp. A120]|eukprot:GSA120T00008995001.1